MDTGTKLGTLSLDKPAKNHDTTSTNGYTNPTPSWGTVISIFEGFSTKYYYYTFSLRSFESKQYGYGDLWIYKADQTNTGSEFYRDTD